MGVEDELFLPEAIKDGMILVSYDQKTIAPLLKLWAETGVDHTGVVFVDHKTIPPQDFGGLISALCHLWRTEQRADWTNRVIFLRPPPGA